MTKLSITATLNSNKEIIVANTTGFAPTNADGFLQSSVVIDMADATLAKKFKLSEVYLFNVLLYNAYNKTPVVLNVVNNNIELPIQITDDASFATESQKTYIADKDGFYTVAQLIALNKDFYEANKTSLRFTGTDYIVYDPDEIKLYHAKNGVYTSLSIIELLDEDLTVVDYMRSYVYKFSYINLKNCYITNTGEYLDVVLKGCPIGNEYIEYHLIYCTIEVIKYQIELCNFSSAQKYIEWIDGCAGVCGSTTSVNCNCSK